MTATMEGSIKRPERKLNDVIVHNTNPAGDHWSNWLLNRRHGGDPAHEPVVRSLVERIRDRVLDGAQLSPGMVIVDAGAGDGLIAFGAFERMGGSLNAVLTDISVPLLERAEKCATERGLRDRCTFLNTPVETLEGVADASADVLTCRAVLAYISDKAAAFKQFHRVLKPGGRISIGEPIYQDDALQLAALTRHLETQPHDDANLQFRLHQRWRAAQLPSRTEDILKNPLTNFTERDLVAICQFAGFGEIHLELHIDVRKGPTMSWDTFINLAPRPQTPTLREILESSFTQDERQLFEKGLRPMVESGQIFERDAVAYLTAVKPK
jgi:SAM-dependent methyltransferase